MTGERAQSQWWRRVEEDNTATAGRSAGTAASGTLRGGNTVTATDGSDQPAPKQAGKQRDSRSARR